MAFPAATIALSELFAKLHGHAREYGDEAAMEGFAGDFLFRKQNDGGRCFELLIDVPLPRDKLSESVFDDIISTANITSLFFSGCKLPTPYTWTCTPKNDCEQVDHFSGPFHGLYRKRRPFLM